MTPDETLSAFFAEQAPSARDLVFQAVVAERIARRRAWGTIAALAPWTLAAITLCWTVGPIFAPIAAGMGQALGPAAALLTVTALGVWMARGLGRAASRRFAPI